MTFTQKELASTNGWQAQAIKEAAGGKGSKVHQVISDLLRGVEINVEKSEYINPSTKKPEHLTFEEWEAICSFSEWYFLTRPKIIGNEIVVWNEKEKYAGTADLVCSIKDSLWIVDFKTSQSIWPSHRLQLSAYKHAREEWSNAKLLILQLGYKRNNSRYKPTEVQDCFNLFLNTKQIWEQETKGQVPYQRDYPIKISLDIEGDSNGRTEGLRKQDK